MFMKKYTYICWIHTDAINNRRTQKDFFIKIFTLFVRVQKGCMGFYCERELEIEQKLQYFDPKLMAVDVVSFSFSDAQPEALGLTLLGAGFLYCILSATSLDPNSSGPQAPSAWCGFPYLISSPTGCHSTGLTSVLTELYNSSTPTWSPTRSLKSNV